MSSRHRHSHPMFRPERNHWFEGYGMMGYKSHPPMLGQGGHQKYSLHPRETFADAAARTATEGEIGELRPGIARRGRPALRIESQWIGEITYIMMHDVLAHQYE